jgi:hypothetical protein
MATNSRRNNHSYLTTGEVGRALGVAPRTVCQWFDAGFFPGSYRMPSHNAGRLGAAADRRIPVAAAVAFCRGRAVPVPREWAARAEPPVLCVGLPGRLAAALAAALPGWRLVPAANGFEAGVLCGDNDFRAVVVDAATVGSEAAGGLLHGLRLHPRQASARLVALTAEDDDGRRWAGSADVVLRPPVAAAVLAAAVLAAAGKGAANGRA